MHEDKRDQLESVYGGGKAAQEHLGHLHRSQVNERKRQSTLRSRGQRSQRKTESIVEQTGKK